MFKKLNYLLLIIICFYLNFSIKGQTTLYSENFDGITAYYPLTTSSTPWKVVNTTGGTTGNLWAIYPACSPPSATKCLEMYYSSYDCYYSKTTTTDKTAYCATKVDATNYVNLKLNFKWKAGGVGDLTNDYLKVVYSSDGITWYDVTTTKYNNSTTWQTVSDLSMPSGCEYTSFYIGFRWVNNSSGGDNSGPCIDDISITGAVGTTLSATSLNTFGNVCTNLTSSPNTFTITGTNLTSDNVTVGALTGYTYSTDNSNYSTSLSLTHNTGSYTQLIYVKFSPTQVQSYSGNIVIGGGGASNKNVAASGTGVNTASAISTPTSTGVTTNSATLGGNITTVGCPYISERGIYYSTTSGFADGTGTKVSETGVYNSNGTYTVNATGLNSSTMYYYKAFATSNAGTVYTSQGTYTTLCAPLSGTINIGTGQAITSLTGSGGLFEKLNSCGVSGNITAIITSDLTETGTNALNQWTGGWKLTINPSGARTISGSVSSKGLIGINGADSVIIDGLNSNGNSLTISNTSTSSSTGTSTIQFLSDATYNSITNCTLLGSATGTGLTSMVCGVIIFGTGTSIGNINNKISFCNISSAGTNLPSRGIYSKGTSDAIQNKYNTIDHCNIYDVFVNATCASIYLFDYNSDWTITNNKIYQTSARTTGSPIYGIYIYHYSGNGGNGFQINNNTIGYSSQSNTGLYTITSTSTISAFVGIHINAGIDSPSNINGNTISNFLINNSPYYANFYGIECQSGNVNIGSQTSGGNIIQNVSGQIYTLYGIYSSVSNLSTNCIDNNIINNLTSSYSSGNNSICGIFLMTGKARKNYIYNLGGTQSTGIAKIYGIWNSGPNSSNTYEFSNNMISLSGENYSNPIIYGFYDNSTYTLPSYNFYFNSINITGNANTSSNTYAFFRNNTNSYTLKNNILVNQKSSGGSGKNYVIYLNSTGNFISDYNNVFSTSTGTNFTGYYGADKQTFANWQSSFLGCDLNSTTANPNFVSTTNLHLTSNNIGEGISISDIITDVDNDLRSTPPMSKGADEAPIPLPYFLTASIDTINSGNNILMTLSGTGIISSTIKWYKDICCNTLIGTGDNISVSSTGNTTYFAEYNLDFQNRIWVIRISIILNFDGITIISGGTVSSDYSICKGNTGNLLTLSGNSGSIIKWQYAFSPYTSWFDIQNTNPTYSPGVILQTTKYRAVSKFANILDFYSNPATITVNQPPQVTPSNNLICVGETIKLSASGGGQYLWTGPQFSSTDPEKIIPNATISQSGLYNVVVTGVNGCTSSAVSIVQVFANPIVDAGINQAICYGSSVLLTASGGNNYLWNNGESTSSITVSPQSTTIYKVEGTNLAGCKSNDQVEVSVYPAINLFSLIMTPSNCVKGGVIKLSGSEIGVSYQLLLNGSPVGSPQTGTGDLLDFGTVNINGIYTIKATRISDGCLRLMNGSYTI